MDKNDLLIEYKAERRYTKSQLKQTIHILKNILNRIEEDIDSDTIRANDGLQGKEWHLYKELSELEKYNKIIKDLERLKE